MLMKNFIVTLLGSPRLMLLATVCRCAVSTAAEILTSEVAVAGLAPITRRSPDSGKEGSHRSSSEGAVQPRDGRNATGHILCSTDIHLMNRQIQIHRFRENR